MGVGLGFHSRSASTALLGLLLLLYVFHINSATASPGLCSKPRLEDSFLLYRECCCSYRYGNLTSRVAEVNGAALEKALNVVRAKDDAYAVVLFYAAWCPFSKIVRPFLDTLSMEFGSVYHFAAEDSSVQPSALSQYGVHSFPVLFLYHKNLKIRYRGPRTLDSIRGLYQNVTGFGLVSCSQNDGDGVSLIEKLSTEGIIESKVNCPYPWIKSPEKWLQDEVYLLLATMFLIFRVLMYLMPRMLTRIKYYWVQKELCIEAYKSFVKNVILRKQDTFSGFSSRSLESDVLRKGKAVLSVPTWPSSSLAPVTLSEGSSHRIRGMQDSHQD